MTCRLCNTGRRQLLVESGPADRRAQQSDRLFRRSCDGP